ncbi:MAG: hypothetical protein H0U23_15620 [Blastocatellia bacterium]|nr:hypothetical protein [Blastocatellia bacterium]
MSLRSVQAQMAVNSPRGTRGNGPDMGAYELAPLARNYTSFSHQTPERHIMIPIARSLVKAALLLAAALLSPPLQAQRFDPPSGYIVNSTANTDDSYLPDQKCDDGTGRCTLRAAIQNANFASNFTQDILFNIPTTDPGYDAQTSSYTIRVSISPMPDVTDSVNIIGPGVNKLAVRYPQRRGYSTPLHIFNVTTSGAVNFTGLTIGGIMDGETSGGGIQNSNTGTVSISSCVITGHVFFDETTNSKGAGVYNISGTVDITNSTISQNAVTAQPYSGFGGGIANESGTVNVTNSRIVNNSCIGGAGGGIYNATGTVSLTNSEVSGNFAGSDDDGDSVGGGAIFNGGTLNVTNTTISGNGALNLYAGFGSYGGGGILNGTRYGTGATVNLSNSTITGNSLFGIATGGGGGGIANLYSAGTVNVKSSIIALNSSPLSLNVKISFALPPSSGPDVYGAFTSQGFNLIGIKDGSTGFTLAQIRREQSPPRSTPSLT